MRKSSKAISLLLSGLMATSCFSMAAVTATAATVDSEPTGVMTKEERIAAGHELVYFKFPEKLWGPLTGIKWSTKKHTVNVCCNFYAIYGNKKEVKSRAWEAPSTNMMADESGSDTFYYDITEGKQIAEKDDKDNHKMEPGAAYGILFSTKANAGDANTLKPNSDGYQTCDLYFDTNCIGTTFVVDTPAVTRENTANSQKIDYYAHSLNGISKPIRKISTLCAYIDGMGKELDGKTQINGNTLSYVPDSLETANRLKDYLPNPTNEPSFSRAKVATMMEKFETNSVDVYWMYDERFGKDYAKGTQYVHADGADDLKPDGTLKDVYRRRSLEVDPGTAEAKTEFYPDYDLVAERLGLTMPVPKQIKDVYMTLDTNPTQINTPEDANYTVSVTKDSSGNNVATVSPKAGYAFTAKPDLTLTAFPEEGTTVAYDNGKTFIDAVDGKIIVTYPGSDPVPVDEPIETVALYPVDDAHLAAGQTAPAVTRMPGAQYTPETTFAPAVDDVFAYDTDYTMTVNYTADDGFCFNESTQVNCTGFNPSNITTELVDNKHFKVQYTFKTEKKAINAIELDFGGNVINKGADAAVPTVAADADYTVASAVWEPADSVFAADTDYTLTVTLDAKEHCAFGNGASFTYTNFGEGSAAYNEVSQNVVDGKEVIVLSFHTDANTPAEDTYLVAGDQADLFGTAWDAGNQENLMTKNDDGTYTKSYTAEKAYDVVQLKVVKNGAEWIGDAEGNNIAFALTGAGTFTVKYNPETNQIEVLDRVENGGIVTDAVFNYTDVYVAGNGEKNWLNGAAWDTAYAANQMNKVADGVFEIEFKDVTPGFDRQFKFAIDGSWTYNFGASKAEDAPAFEPGVAMDAGWDGGNITFDTEDDYSDIKIQLDLRDFDFVTKKGAKYTVWITESEDGPIFGDVDGDGVVTINDATLIQRRGVELEVFTAEQDLLADVNRDGRVSILDVTCISRYLAEMTEGTGWTGVRLKDVVNAD